MLVEAMQINSHIIGNINAGFSNAIIEKYSKFNEAYYGETQMDYLFPLAREADEKVTTTNVWNLLLQSVYFKLNNSILTHKHNYYENMESQFHVLMSKLVNSIDKKEYLKFINIFNEIKETQSSVELSKLYKDIKNEREKKNIGSHTRDINVEEIENRKDILYSLTEKYSRELNNNTDESYKDLEGKKDIIYKIVSNNTVDNNRDIYELLKNEKIIFDKEKNIFEKENKGADSFNNVEFVKLIKNADEDATIKIINMINSANKMMYNHVLENSEIMLKSENINKTNVENISNRILDKYGKNQGEQSENQVYEKNIMTMRNFSEKVLVKMSVIATQNQGIIRNVEQVKRDTLGEVIAGVGEEEVEDIYEYFVGERLLYRQEEAEKSQNIREYLYTAVKNADRETIEKISDRLLEIKDIEISSEGRKITEKNEKNIITMRNFSEKVLDKMTVIATQNQGIIGNVEQARRTTLGEVIAGAGEEEAEDIYEYFAEENLILRQDEAGIGEESQNIREYLYTAIKNADRETIEKISDRLLEIYERNEDIVYRDEKEIKTDSEKKTEVKKETSVRKEEVNNLREREINSERVHSLKEKETNLEKTQSFREKETNLKRIQSHKEKEINSEKIQSFEEKEKITKSLENSLEVRGIIESNEKNIITMKNFSEKVLDKMTVIATQNQGIIGDVEQARRLTLGEVIAGAGEEEAEHIYEYFVGENLILRQEEAERGKEESQNIREYLYTAIKNADREIIEKISDRILDIYENNEDIVYREEREIKEESEKETEIKKEASVGQKEVRNIREKETSSERIHSRKEKETNLEKTQSFREKETNLEKTQSFREKETSLKTIQSRKEKEINSEKIQSFEEKEKITKSLEKSLEVRKIIESKEKNIITMRNFSEKVLDKMTVIATQNQGIIGDVEQVKRLTLGEVIAGAGEEEAENIYEYFVGEKLILRQEEAERGEEERHNVREYLCTAIKNADKEIIEKISDRVLDIYEKNGDIVFSEEGKIKTDSEEKTETKKEEFVRKEEVNKLREKEISSERTHSLKEKETNSEKIQSFIEKEKSTKDMEMSSETIKITGSNEKNIITMRNFSEKVLDKMTVIAIQNQGITEDVEQVRRATLGEVIAGAGEEEAENIYEYFVGENLILRQEEAERGKEERQDTREYLYAAIKNADRETIEKISDRILDIYGKDLNIGNVTLRGKNMMAAADEEYKKIEKNRDLTEELLNKIIIHTKEKEDEEKYGYLVGNSFVINKHKQFSKSTTVPVLKRIVNEAFEPTYYTMLSEQVKSNIIQKRYGIINYFLTENSDDYKLESQIIYNYLYSENTRNEIMNKLSDINELNINRNIGQVLAEAVDRMSYNDIELLFEDMIMKVPRFKVMYETFSENSQDSFIQGERQNELLSYKVLGSSKDNNSIAEYEISEAGELKYRTEPDNSSFEENIQKSIEKNVVKYVNMEQKVVEKESFETKEIIDKQVKQINALARKIDEQEEKIKKLTVKSTNSTINYENIRMDVMNHIERELRLEKMRRGLD